MLVCLSAHQRTLPFAALEQLAALGAGTAPDVRDAHADIQGAVVLATCNRFEAYVDIAENPTMGSAIPAIDAALQTIADRSGVPYRTVRDGMDVRNGNQAARHLFAVASGLESVALGEDEIAGQVRRALESARSAALTTPALEQLFQRASETSRTVKTSTRVGESGRSLARLAVTLIDSRVASWPSAHVVLIGTGRYAAATLAALRRVGAENIHVHSRSGHRSFADREGLSVIAPEDIDVECALADVIITCTTTATGYALDAGTHEAHRTSTSAPQVIVDLGLPRNVDPRVATLAGVELLDLESIRLHAPLDETAQLGDAHDLIGEAVHRHAVAARVHDVAPAVVALRRYVDEHLENEIQRLRDRGSDPAAERALRHFAGVISHGLIGHGHRAAARGEGSTWAHAIARVFGDGDSP